jgi:DNA modification methylase
MSEQTVTVNLDDIRFEKEYYSRTESQSPKKVQEYAISIADGNFPPILLNQEHILLDGWHRWKASIAAKLTTIDATILDTTGWDLHKIRRKASRANVRSGIPETDREVQRKIREEYRDKLELLDQKGREQLKQEMAEDYSRSLRYIRKVTSRIDKDYKAELRETAFELWMACYSNVEIAERVGYTEKSIREFIDLLHNRENGTSSVSPIVSENDELTLDALQEFDESADTEIDDDSNSLGVYELDKRLLIKANHLDEHYKPPLYNIWKQQEKSDSVGHFGNSEVTWLDHLLYLYTAPFDIIIDPFGGGGSTIDLCKSRLRRYLVSDRQPIDIRSDIRRHDITDGILSPPAWKTVKLVYLDPPYWKQAEGKYSVDPTDLANMDLERFTVTLVTLIKEYAEKLKRARVEDAVIALLMQPTQWRAPEHAYTDHIADLLRSVKLPLDMRFSVPYESQQYNAQMVEWAKAQKKCLVLTRELIVWRVA